MTKRLVCFGDSLTAYDYDDDGSERLIPRLQKGLPGWDVINAGSGGNNTYAALERINADVISHSPDFVAVFFGANDAADYKLVPLGEFEANILKITEMISPSKTLLITPAPVNENIPLGRTNAVMKIYGDAVKRVAAKTGCHVVDLFAVMIASSGFEKLFSDGIHFSEKGYVLLAPLILDYMKANIL